MTADSLNGQRLENCVINYLRFPSNVMLMSCKHYLVVMHQHFLSGYVISDFIMVLCGMHSVSYLISYGNTHHVCLMIIAPEVL